MEFQWIIWRLTSLNAIWVTNAFLRHVQDKAALCQWCDLGHVCKHEPCCGLQFSTGCLPSLWNVSPNKLCPGGRAFLSHLRGCHHTEPLFTWAGSHYGRATLDTANGHETSENQQYLCHSYPHALSYCFFLRWSGSFLVNLYILMIFLLTIKTGRVHYISILEYRQRQNIRALSQKTHKVR